MLDGYACCEMLYEDGKPHDFIYLDVNPAFERLTGLAGVVGKKVSELIPGIREANPELFDIYGRVVRTGKPENSRPIWLRWGFGFQQPFSAPVKDVLLPCSKTSPSENEWSRSGRLRLSSSSPQ